jgi:hypothetical protein
MLRCYTIRWTITFTSTAPQTEGNRELAALDMERSLALLREGTRKLMVAYANLPDALKAVHKADAGRVPGRWMNSRSRSTKRSAGV